MRVEEGAVSRPNRFPVPLVSEIQDRHPWNGPQSPDSAWVLGLAQESETLS